MITRLSPSFRLAEFLVSQVATRNDIDMSPTGEVVDELRRLCAEILQPLRDDLGVPILVTSGFRPPALNHAIGGSKSSAHVFGRAADIKVIGKTPLEVCRRIVELDLPFDQVIHEFGDLGWTHVGIAEAGNAPRLEELTAYRRAGATRYALGLVEMDLLRA